MTLITVLAAAAIAQASTTAERPSADDPLVRTRLEMRISEAVLMAYRNEMGALPLEKDVWISLETLGEKLDTVFARRLPMKDAWGHPLRATRRGAKFTIASDGPDGIPTFKNTQEPSGDDLVLADGRFLDPAMWTMSILRTLATAIESRAVDLASYPGPTGGLVPVSSLEPLLAPIYIRELSATDAWGNPILVYSEPQRYFLLSLGSDGKAETEYDPRKTGTWVKGGGGTGTPDRDILFVNGQFAQWPENLCPE